MKLAKKLISAVAAIAMVASAFTALTVNAASPAVTASVTVADDKSYVDYTWSYAGAEAKAQTGEYKVKIDSSLFDISYLADYDYHISDAIDDEAAEGCSTDLTANRALLSTFSYNNDIYAWVFSSTATTAGKTLPAAQENVYTLRIYVKDGANSSVWTDGYTFTVESVAFGFDKPSNNASFTVEEAKIEASAPAATATPEVTPTVEPTATPEPTPEVTPEPTATPEPTEGKGVEKFSATDAAAWAWKTAAAAGSKVAVTVNANGEEVSKTFDLNAAVEGTVKVGIVVQYNPTAFANFEIVNVDVQ